ncbi:MAG: hypothetical protein NVS1B1_14070 [Candidatus Limnocylindrales bacterium]
MADVVRVDKRIPGGSLWQRRSGYRLTDRDGLARVYQPAGTPWWNPLGGWIQQTEGIAVFGADLPFAISCHGPDDDKRFYIDVVRWNRIGTAVIEYLDLYLDVMIDAGGAVTEKDEHQLVALDLPEQAAVRATRDAIRARITARDPLFDPTSPFYEVPDEVRALPPVPLEPEGRGRQRGTASS